MVKKRQDWIETDVCPYQDKSVAWLSQYHFFRDPIRPTYSDLSYDVDGVTPFNLKQNQSVVQGRRFSQVRYGSQVDLIVTLSDRFDFATMKEVGDHVEAGIDPIIKVTEKVELR